MIAAVTDHITEIESLAWLLGEGQVAADVVLQAVEVAVRATGVDATSARQIAATRPRMAMPKRLNAARPTLPVMNG